MKIKTNIKDNCFIIIVVILMISFTANIYQAILMRSIVMNWENKIIVK